MPENVVGIASRGGDNADADQTHVESERSEIREFVEMRGRDRTVLNAEPGARECAQ